MINITGDFSFSFDPTSFYLYNVVIDMRDTTLFYFARFDCNYPEAYKTTEVISDNVTTIHSYERQFLGGGIVFGTNMAGNITLTNWNLKQNYGVIQRLWASIANMIEPM